MGYMRGNSDYMRATYMPCSLSRSHSSSGTPSYSTPQSMTEVMSMNGPMTLGTMRAACCQGLRSILQNILGSCNHGETYVNVLFFCCRGSGSHCTNQGPEVRYCGIGRLVLIILLNPVMPVVYVGMEGEALTSASASGGLVRGAGSSRRMFMLFCMIAVPEGRSWSSLSSL